MTAKCLLFTDIEEPPLNYQEVKQLNLQLRFQWKGPPTPFTLPDLSAHKTKGKPEILTLRHHKNNLVIIHLFLT